MDEQSCENVENETLATVSDTFEDAKAAEMNKWRENRVYEEVQAIGQPTVGFRWVLTIKNDGKKSDLLQKVSKMRRVQENLVCLILPQVPKKVCV